MTETGTPLVERGAELRALERAAAEVRSGKARLVLLTGEAGIGKTALWSAFADLLDPDWQFDYVGAHHTDRSFAAPFEHLAGELPESADSARALADAVANGCRDRSKAGPLLLVVEDLHFVDPVAVTALPHLLTRLRREPVLLVATYRLGSHPVGAEHTRAVADLLRHPGAFELRVNPLSPDGVAELAIRLTGDDDPSRAEQVHQQTAGNPFFVEALMQTGDTGDADSAVPWTVAEAVVAVVETVPEDARQLAELLAASGKPLAPAVLDALLDAWGSAAMCLCESGLANQLAGGELALRHALVADALLQQAGGRAIAARHRQLAEALIRSGAGDDESLARHWSSAGERAIAAPHAVKAASRLSSRGAHARASELYDLALSEAAAAQLDKATLFERSALAAAAAGRTDRARTLGQLAEQARAAEGQEWQAGGNWVNTVLMRQVENASSGPDESEPGLDDEAIALITQAQEAINLADLTRARSLAAKAAELAIAAHDDATASTAALAFCYAGEPETAASMLADITDRARGRGDWVTLSVVASRWSRLAFIMGDLASAIERNLEALAAGRSSGGPELWGHLSLGTAYIEASAGYLDAARTHCEQVLSEDQPLLAEYAKAPQTVIAVERGDLVAAHRLLDTMLPIVRALGIGYYWLPVLTLLSRLQLLEGDTAGALESVSEADAVRWSPYNDYAVDLLLTRAVAAHLDGELGLLADAEHGLTIFDDAIGGPVSAGAVSFVRALRLSALNVSEAIDAFDAAAQAWTTAPRHAFAAEAWCEAAIAAATTDPTAARAYLDQAIERATECRMPRIAWRAATVAHLIGVDLAVTPTPPPSAAAPTQLRELTTREREIVERVAAGRTNREVADELALSDKTVRNYLSNAFTKLGVTRRAELIALVRPPADDR